MDEITSVTILKFAEYNYRKDVNNPSWFRFQHSFFENPDFFEFTHSEKLMWVYMLCCASKRNAPCIHISWAHAEKVGGFKRKDFEILLSKLNSLGIVTLDGTSTLRERYASVTHTGLTDKQTNKHLTNTGAFPIEDLIAEQYPKRSGQLRKSDGIRRLHKLIKTESDFAAFSAAVKIYREECERNGKIGTPYVMQLTTFANNWREFSEESKAVQTQWLGDDRKDDQDDLPF